MQSKLWPIYSLVVTSLLALMSASNSSISAQKTTLMEDKQYLIEQLSDKLIKLEILEEREDNEKDSIRSKITRLNPSINSDLLADSVEAVYSASKEFSVDQDLIIAVAHEESDFNPKAISPHGAMGLMQVMPLWLNEIEFLKSPSDLLDVKINIRAGAYILNQYSKMFHGNRQLALLAYNRGPGTVLNLIQSGENPDNGYPSIVLASYERVKH